MKRIKKEFKLRNDYEYSLYAGIAIAAKVPMMATTTISSTRENPRLDFKVFIKPPLSFT